MTITPNGETIPITILTADDNELVDTMTIEQFDYDGKAITFHEPKTFEIRYRKELSAFVIDEPSIGLLIVDPDTETIKELLPAYLRSLWNIVKYPTDKLSDANKRIRDNLLRLAEE